jgi:monoterpene epsilon-lactone hydrolase
MQDDGTIPLPGFELPLSGLLGAHTRGVLLQWLKLNEKIRSELVRCGGGRDADSVGALRAFLDREHYPSLITRYRAQYGVHIQSRSIAGVHIDAVTPAAGVPAENTKRVLINLHGGAFIVGARLCGQLEAIPVAALTRTRVLTVDYRMAPEHRFPAATEDVLAVYREILKQYESRHIGIYGCSAGATLTAQVIASLQREALPLPAAVGMFHAAGSFWDEGDSGRFGAAISGLPLRTSRDNAYFKDADPDDPLVFPVRSDEVMSRFPPSLFIAATRDQCLSSVVHMHSRLTALGVKADLHVWEGLGHAFFYNSDLPQSREAYDVIARFFARHLCNG